MAHELTEPIAPDLLTPEPFAALAGDTTDDDGPALDDIFEAPSHGPIDYGTLIPATDSARPQSNRALTRFLRLTPIDGSTPADPVQLFPADPNRTKLLMTVITAGTCRFAGEKSDVYSGAKLISNLIYDFTGYTGAIWFYYEDVANFASINVLLVTS